MAPTPLVSVPDVRGQAYVFAKERWRSAASPGGSSARWPATPPTPSSRRRRRPVPGSSTPACPRSCSASSAASTPRREAGERIALHGHEDPLPPPDGGSEGQARGAKPKAKSKPVAKPKTKPRAKPKPKVTSARPAAFPVARRPRRPQDELALPERARRLEQWLRTHSKPTNANVQHWLYQHEWLVTGARFGWWRGAAAPRDPRPRRPAGPAELGDRERARRRPPRGARSPPCARRAGDSADRASSSPACCAATRRLRALACERSLVEPLQVTVILAVVIGALTTVFVRAMNSELDMNQRFQAQQEARLAVDKMRREIH